MARRRNRDAARHAWTVALLVLSFVLSVFLAVRAQVAAQYHRSTAADVLRGYAQLVTDEFVRRAANQIGYANASPLLESLVAGTPPKNPSLARRTFTYTKGREPFPMPAENLGVVVRDQRTLLYTVRGERIVGFELNPDALPPLMIKALERPLLPPSLSKGRVDNRDLFLRVVDPRGVEIYRSRYGSEFDRELGVRREITDEPLLRGMRIEASIDRDAAADLIIGGLPRSPARLYIGIVILSGALLTVAILQLRRERALARMRSDFVSSVSHELRTPLTQIRMFAETLLLDRVRSNDERRRALTVIDQEARRLTSLVENVLSFSRRERGTLEIERRAVELTSVVRSAVEAFAPIATARKMTIHLDAAEPLIAHVDEDAVRQIVVNLVDNAVKYGPEGQRIRVEVRRQFDDAALAVEDEGVGIPQRERGRVFERYVRLQREITGAGIGLSVVRELVELHRGRCRIEDARGGGARIVVTLPLAEGPR